MNKRRELSQSLSCLNWDQEWREDVQKGAAGDGDMPGQGKGGVRWQVGVGAVCRMHGWAGQGVNVGHACMPVLLLLHCPRPAVTTPEDQAGCSNCLGRENVCFLDSLFACLLSCLLPPPSLLLPMLCVWVGCGGQQIKATCCFLFGGRRRQCREEMSLTTHIIGIERCFPLSPPLQGVAGMPKRVQWDRMGVTCFYAGMLWASSHAELEVVGVVWSPIPFQSNFFHNGHNPTCLVLFL